MILKLAWWKWLGVIIITVTIILGLFVPLKPGVTSVEPFAINAGQTVTLDIQGYNTFFKDAKVLDIWLKPDETHALKSNNVEVVNQTRISVTFEIPSEMPHTGTILESALVINSDVDGAFVRPSAVVIRKTDTSGSGDDKAKWLENPIGDLYTLNAFRFPFRNILFESIKNTYFHIPMWFGMILLFLGSFVLSIRYLRNPLVDIDNKVTSLVGVGILFGIMGLATGALWAKYTWGAYWSGDIKQNMSLICLLIYSAYFVLRASMKDEERKGRVSAVYNIFAFVAMIPLLFVIPRMQDSLHPGSGGNPALGGEDLDNTMRMIFYPAIIGWTLIGLWMAEMNYRIKKLERNRNELE